MQATEMIWKQASAVRTICVQETADGHTGVEVTVNVKVGDVHWVSDTVVALDELWQALIEEPLHQLDIVTNLWKSTFQTELSLHTR